MRYKKLSAFVFCLFILQCSFAQKINFKLYGNTTGNYKGNIYLFFEGNYKQRDSLKCPIENGKFYFQGTISGITLARLHLNDNSLITDFYLDKGDSYITCEASYRIHGSDTMNIINVTSVKDSKSFQIQKRMEDALFKIQRSPTSVEEKKEECYSQLSSFIKVNPKNKLSAYFLGNNGSRLTYSQLQELYNLLDPSLKNTFEIKIVEKQLSSLSYEALRKPGLEFHDIVSKDTSGNVIDTKKFRGKYLLVVCWAQWCSPCRKEHPALNELYEKYKNNDFEMLGISFDEMKNKEKWKQAIIKDQLMWPQVSDLNGYDSEISQYYKLKGEGIPFNFLIDVSGKIIGSHLAIETITAVLEDAFKKS